jgi:gluconolactonase
MSKLEVIAEGLAFPEGPVVMADGSVIVVEIMGKKVTRCWGDLRKETVSEPGGGPNGAAIGPDGGLYICNSGGHGQDGTPKEQGRIERIDLATGKAEWLYDSCDGIALGAPNDLMFDCDGNMWFTDLGNTSADAKFYGGLYCARADGSAITRIYGRGISYNGVGISPDMQTVYVSDTYTARVYAYDRKIKAQEPRWLATAPGPVWLDSLAMSAAGNVCVATLMPGAITTVTPQGQTSQEPLDDRLVTNLAFGGADMMDAWITFSEAGTLVKRRWSEPGMRLVYNG